MSELRDWLRGHKLEQYADAFEANDIDLDILPDLNERDLEQLGVSLGNRRRLLKAIAERGAAANETKPAAPDAPAASGDAERRQVTVLFCDMVGSTALSGTVDPELLGNLIRRYQDAAAGAIGRFGGFVAKFMGDGILAYFGFPRAFEDAAERAVRAAIDDPGGNQRHRAAGRHAVGRGSASPPASSLSAKSSAAAPRKSAPSSAKRPTSPRDCRRWRRPTQSSSASSLRTCWVGCSN